MSWLRIKQQLFHFDDLKHLTDADFEALDAYSQKILTTARNWLNGQKLFVLETSGSTGKPQTFTFNREQIRQSVQQTVNAFDLQPGDLLLHCLSVDYVAGFMMLMRGLVNDMPLEVVEPTSNPLKEVPSDQPYAFTAMVPLQLETMLREDPGTAFFDSLKALILGGAPVAASLKQAIEEKQWPVYQTYGMTETLTHVAIRPLWEHGESPYQALQGIAFDQDERDCLIIHTPLYETPIQTNDVVNLLDQHTFKWRGRYDHVINSGGHKIQVEEVEKAVENVWLNLVSHPPDFFVAGIPDESLGEKAVLVVEPGTLDEPLEKSLFEGLRKRLHPYEVPKAVVAVDHFIYTNTGKIDRKRTLASYQ